ncbi:MAG: hypothetical protein AN487_21850 [Anabaena sp. CRKS33]|nr:MAG: hypothetical protein AN487_21850 [Anabaena sp. CRKS33]
MTRSGGSHGEGVGRARVDDRPVHRVTDRERRRCVHHRARGQRAGNGGCGRGRDDAGRDQRKGDRAAGVQSAGCRLDLVGQTVLHHGRRGADFVERLEPTGRLDLHTSGQREGAEGDHAVGDGAQQNRLIRVVGCRRCAADGCLPLAGHGD